MAHSFSLVLGSRRLHRAFVGRKEKGHLRSNAADEHHPSLAAGTQAIEPAWGGLGRGRGLWGAGDEVVGCGCDVLGRQGSRGWGGEGDGREGSCGEGRGGEEGEFHLGGLSRLGTGGLGWGLGLGIALGGAMGIGMVGYCGVSEVRELEGMGDDGRWEMGFIPVSEWSGRGGKSRRRSSGFL